jgi:AAA family ATP:ADP antiporter
MKSYKDLHHHLPKDARFALLWIMLSYFMVLFTYPMMRSTTGSIFLEVYTADDLPSMWFTSVLSLSFLVPLLSQLQKRFSVPVLFSGTSFVTIILMVLGLNFYESGVKEMAFVMAVIKEVYIVILIHQIIGYCNAHLNLDEIKLIYGPITAMGGLGGIIGGQLTSLLVKDFGTNALLQAAILSLIFALGCFLMGRKLNILDPQHKAESHDVSPLASIKGVGSYVFLIVAVIALTQFIINIADLQFNKVFQSIVTAKDERTAYYGQLYSWVNGVQLLISVFGIKIILERFSTKSVHIFIPVFYFSLIALGLGLGGGTLAVVAFVFIGFKATDYSLFAVAKELLYQPLSALQRYGAKYIADMFAYRGAKATISVVLMLTKPAMGILYTMQFIFIGAWIGCIILLYKKQKTLT